MTGSTRRGFLGFLAAAPMAIPAAVKAASASNLAAAELVRGKDLFDPSQMTIFDSNAKPVLEPLKIEIDTSEVRRAIEEIERYKYMSSIHHDGKAEHVPGCYFGDAPFRIGDWMQTASGVEFYPLDPRPQEIHIEDIAHSLSMLCRYGGHAHTFYSVAEHCVHVANAAPDELKLTALMHDASEAYLTDIIRPVKPFLSNYISFENRLMRAIADRFDFQWPMPPEVKRLDNAILVDERDQAMTRPPRDWNLPEPALGVELQFWTPQKARYEFLASFQRFGGHIC